MEITPNPSQPKETWEEYYLYPFCQESILLHHLSKLRQLGAHIYFHLVKVSDNLTCKKHMRYHMHSKVDEFPETAVSNQLTALIISPLFILV